MGYTAALKEQMVRRMMGPPGKSATALAREVGVSQTQLSRWLKQALEAAKAETAEDTQGEQAGARKWTAEEKLRVLANAHGMEGEVLGALLRREGLHQEQLRGSTRGGTPSGPVRLNPSSAQPLLQLSA